MRYLIFGAGTIGITYAWLLSRKYDVDLLVKPEQYNEYSKEIIVDVKDIRQKAKDYERKVYHPKCVMEINTYYDAVIVAVNRFQLKTALPELKQKQKFVKSYVFMQNNWNIRTEIQEYLPLEKTIIMFPSNVGGGRIKNNIKVILFREPARIGGEYSFEIENIREALRNIDIKTHYDKKIYDWLCVHYLMQSVTAGAVLKSKSFESLAGDSESVCTMVKALREGIAVCYNKGVHTKKIWMSKLIKLPLHIVTHFVQKMLLNQNTVDMVNNHMLKGLPEWIFGYNEILKEGLEQGLPMTDWKSYSMAVEEYKKIK